MTHASELIARAGLALYGPEWTGLLAHDLGINERTMRRIKAAFLADVSYPVAPGALQDLAELLRTRSQVLAALAREIEQAPHSPEA